MESLQNITANYIAENFDFFKRQFRYHSGLQQGLYRKLNELSIVLTSFVKEMQGINTVKRIKQTFKPSILKLHLKCIFATPGLCIDLCKKMRDEKMAVTEFLPDWKSYDFDSDLVLEYERTRYLLFRRIRGMLHYLEKHLAEVWMKLFQMKIL